MWPDRQLKESTEKPEIRNPKTRVLGFVEAIVSLE